MTITDRYGLAVATASDAAAAHYQTGMDRLLSYGAGAEASFAAALAADPGLALAHAGAALFSFLQGDGPAARAAIADAERVAPGASRRERQHVAALSAIVGGDGARGLALIEEHVREFPRDAMLVNQGSSMIGFSGRADREPRRLAFVEQRAPDYGDDWWYQSALAFTYHESDRFDESRRLSERSLAQYPGNAGASHNIAHVCFETVDNDGGVEFLEGWLEGYERRAPFYCHLAWHLALFELQRGNADRALEIYERDILSSSSPRHIVMDGSALLWRFKLYGCHEAPSLWQPLAGLAPRVARPGFVFGDVHAALVHAASGDDVSLSALIDALRALAAKGHPIAGTVALPLVRGVAAYASGDYGEALAQLEPVVGELHRIGGSHAQWELFEETMVAAYLKLGRQAEAARLLRRRLDARPSPRDLAWLREAQAPGDPAAGAGEGQRA
jgi:tetratricopeptide (TPR) repeat protein